MSPTSLHNPDQRLAQLTSISAFSITFPTIHKEICITPLPPSSTFFWIPTLVFESIICLLVIWTAWGKDIAWRIKDRLKKEEPALAPNIPDLVKILAQDRCASDLAHAPLRLSIYVVPFSAIYFLGYVLRQSLTRALSIHVQAGSSPLLL